MANKQEKDKETTPGYEKAVQNFQKTSLDHSRNGQLFAAGGISQMKLETSVNAPDDARRQMEGYMVENRRGVADSSYGIQIQNTAFDLGKEREELDNTQIRGTIDGTMVRVNSKMGQSADRVEDDEPILSIESLEQLELEIKASEFFISKVRVGQMATITAGTLGDETAEGEVVKISPTDEEKDGDSTEEVIPAAIRVDGEGSKLIAGIMAKAELLIREAKDVFIVPTSALFDNREVTYIAIVQDMRMKCIPVTAGVGGGVVVEIIPTDGTMLGGGMQVIINPGPHPADSVAMLTTQ